MTVTSPETGLRAQLSQLARGAVAAAIVLGVCVTGTTPAVAETEDTADESSIELFVSAGLHGSVATGSATTATITVQNETEADIAAGRVSVQLGRTPLTDSAAVSSWLDADAGQVDAGNTPFDLLATEETEPLEASDTATTSVLVPQATLRDLLPGIYPIRAELTGDAINDLDSDAPVTATSVLIVTSSSAPQVAVLVPITATPENGALLSAEELTALTAPDGALTAQLDGVAGTAATLAVDPAIATAIRALGAAAPTRVAEWLTRLETLPNERFALQFADADAATQAHAGLSALLQPSDLGVFLDPKDFPSTPSTTTPSTATPTPTPTSTDAPTDDTAPSLPDDTALTSIPNAVPGVLWPRGDVTPDDLTTFAEYLGRPTVTILPSTSIAEATSGHAVAGGHDLLVTDSSVSAALSAAAAEPDAAARERWLTAASAHLALAPQTPTGTPLLVGLDRDETRTAEALRAAVSAVDIPAFDLSALLAAPAASVTLTAEPDESRGDALLNLLDDETTLTAFSSILTDPAVLLSPERIEILRVIAVGSAPDAFTANVSAHRAATEVTLDSVGIQPSSTIQLFASNADFGFWVRNDLPWPVNVRLAAHPSDPRLDVQRETEAVAEALSNTRIKVPVSARVGSGDLDVRLSLSSPTGVPIGSTQYANVSVRAEWETIGLIIFGGLAALLIVGGVVRTVRRKRRDEADAAPAPLEEEEHV